MPTQGRRSADESLPAIASTQVRRAGPQVILMDQVGGKFSVTLMFYHDNINTLWLSLLGMGTSKRSFKGFCENPYVFYYSKCFYICGLVALFKRAKISYVDPIREVTNSS